LTPRKVLPINSVSLFLLSRIPVEFPTRASCHIRFQHLGQLALALPNLSASHIEIHTKFWANQTTLRDAKPPEPLI